MGQAGRNGLNSRNGRPYLEICSERCICSFTLTGVKTYLEQTFFSCFTCSMNNVCSSCIQKCHKGHDYSSEGYKASEYCRCGSISFTGCKTRTTIFCLRPEDSLQILATAFSTEVAVEELKKDEWLVAPFMEKIGFQKFPHVYMFAR